MTWRRKDRGGNGFLKEFQWMSLVQPGEQSRKARSVKKRDLALQFWRVKWCPTLSLGKGVTAPPPIERYEALICDFVADQSNRHLIRRWLLVTANSFPLWSAVVRSFDARTYI